MTRALRTLLLLTAAAWVCGAMGCASPPHDPPEPPSAPSPSSGAAPYDFSSP